MINCKGNSAYDPIIYIHFDKVFNQKIGLTVLPAPHAVGNHVFVAIKIKGHIITLKRAADEGLIDTLRPIEVEYSARFEFLTTDYPAVPKGYEENFEKHYDAADYQASNISMVINTEYPLILGEMSDKNNVECLGSVTDYGDNNSILSTSK